MKRGLLAIGLLAALGTAACLQKDTTSTIYLNEDGTLDWVVFERNVRSDTEEPEARDREEHNYLDAIGRDQHGVAEGFRALGGEDVRTLLLRDSRPYAAMVDARFAGLTSVLAPMLTACNIPFGSDLGTMNGVTTWTLWADVGPDGDAAYPESCDEAFEGVFDAADVTIVLASGRFTKAVGFTLEGSERAVLDEQANNNKALARNNGRLVLSLSWTSGQ